MRSRRGRRWLLAAGLVGLMSVGCSVQSVPPTPTPSFSPVASATLEGCVSATAAPATPVPYDVDQQQADGVSVALNEAILALPGVYAEAEMMPDGGIQIGYKEASPDAAQFRDLVTELSGDAAPAISWVGVGWSGADVDLAWSRIMDEMKTKGVPFSGGRFESEYGEMLVLSPNSTDVTLSNQKVGTVDVRVCIILGETIAE